MGRRTLIVVALGLVQSFAAATPRLQDLARTPLAFEANQGQTDARAAYLARGGGIDLYLTDAGAWLSIVQHPAHAARNQPFEPPWQLEYLPQRAPDPIAPAEQSQALALRYGFAGANPHAQIEPA